MFFQLFWTYLKIGTFTIGGGYAMLPLIEKEVVERLRQAFLNSQKLQQHVRFLYSKGSLYKVFNGNLLYHGCVPLNEDGSFAQIQIFDKTLEVGQVDSLTETSAIHRWIVYAKEDRQHREETQQSYCYQ